MTAKGKIYEPISGRSSHRRTLASALTLLTIGRLYGVRIIAVVGVAAVIWG